MDYLPRTQTKFWEAGRNDYRKRFDAAELEERLKPSYAFLELLTKAFQEGGVPMLAGTDSLMPVVIPGFSIYRELEYLVEAGLSPYEALVTATRTIEVGKQANLILLEKDPLTDIAHVRSQKGIMCRGTWMESAAIQAMLDSIRLNSSPK